jgi:hypothetical protein
MPSSTGASPLKCTGYDSPSLWVCTGNEPTSRARVSVALGLQRCKGARSCVELVPPVMLTRGVEVGIMR